MKKTEKNRKTTVINYYRTLDRKQKGQFKTLVMERTEWAESTFGYKFGDEKGRKKMTKLELEAIELIIDNLKSGKITWN